ncbi:MAG: aminotransferase class V-fold PLP-dependent enzyme [Deltaproteobacteria bacterium]|nr:aminotransferase class V-fold PLP-dependent enzyme [Deltaproteobacteria bacterium]
MPDAEIYLDHAASTPVAPEVRAAFLEALDGAWANPSSRHAPGVLAGRVLERSRDALREAVGSRFRRVVLTSGATEANNVAVLGLGLGGRKRKLVTTVIDHPSVLETLQHAVLQGADAELVPVGPTGEVDVERLAQAAVGASLVAVHVVHNELGTVVDVPALAEALSHTAPEAVLHVDAVQALGKLDLPRHVAGATSVAVTAHKVYGPKGIGALLLAGETSPRPLLFGGEQQDGLRAGTENVPGAAAFAAAARLVTAERPVVRERLLRLDRRLREGVAAFGDRLAPLVPAGRAVPGLVALTLRGLPPEVFLHRLEQHRVYASAGSACHARLSRSAVLQALGAPADVGLIRVSMGRGTTDDHVDAFLAAARASLPEATA